MEENIKVNSKDLLSKIKELIREGNVTKITVKNSEGETVLRIPVYAGLVFLIIAPFMAIIATLTTYIVDYTLVIERKN